MTWVRFTEPWDWRVNYGSTVAYKPGEYNVTAKCATLAIAAGKAVRLRKTNKDEEPVEDAEDYSIQGAASAVSGDTGPGVADDLSSVDIPED